MYLTQQIKFNFNLHKNEDLIQIIPQVRKLCLINQKVYNHGITLIKNHSQHFNKLDLFINKEAKLQTLIDKIKEKDYQLVELHTLYFLGLPLTKKENKLFSEIQLSLIKEIKSLTCKLKFIQDFNLNKNQKRKLFDYLRNYFDLFSKKLSPTDAYLVNKLKKKVEVTQSELNILFHSMNKTLSYPEVDKLYSTNFSKEYRLKLLPAQVIQQTLKEVCEAQKGFYLALAAYNKNPNSFLAKPQFPSYSHNKLGKSLTVTNQESQVSSIFDYLNTQDKEVEKFNKKIEKGNNSFIHNKKSSQKKKKFISKRKKKRKNIKYEFCWSPKSSKLNFLPPILTDISPQDFKEAQVQLKETCLIVRLVYEVKEKEKCEYEELITNLKTKIKLSNIELSNTQSQSILSSELKYEILTLFNQIKLGILSVDLGITNFCSLFNSNSGESLLLKNRKLNKLLENLFKLADKIYSDKDNFLFTQLKQTYFLETGQEFDNLSQENKDKLWKIYQKENKTFKTKKLIRITEKLESKKKTLIHRISRFIVNYANKNNLHTIVIGLNQGWKQGSELFGVQRLFQTLGYSELIEKITYKAKLLGIKVEIQEESYTSKIDHLAGEALCHQANYLGKRIDRDTFVSSTGIELNADVNGAIGICLKYLNKLKTELGLNLILIEKISFSRNKFKTGNKTKLLDKSQLHQVLSPKVFDVLTI